jgi:DNA-binding transcriptional ArsR family regulator
MGFVGALIVVLLALATASVAEGKGQSGLLWFVLGLFFPVVSLLIAALLRPATEAGPVVPSIEDATRSSPVARALHASPSRSAHELTELVGADEREVRRQLSALEQLGLARRDADGRWSLTALGARHLEAAHEG